MQQSTLPTFLKVLAVVALVVVALRRRRRKRRPDRYGDEDTPENAEREQADSRSSLPDPGEGDGRALTGEPDRQDR